MSRIPETSLSHKQARIAKVHRPVGVLVHERGECREFLLRDVDQCEQAALHATQEFGPEMPRQQRADFRRHRDGGDQCTIESVEEIDRLGMPPVAPVGKRDQRPGINE